MIQLLQRIATDHAGALDLLNGRTAHLLEWDGVTAQIARHCRNRRAALAIAHRRPFASHDSIQFQHALADELRPSGQSGKWPPLMDLADGLDLLEMTAPVRYEGADLVHLATVAEHLDDLRQHFLNTRLSCPLWGEAAVQMATFSGISGAIRRALDLDGNIVDGASPLLARLRRTVSGQERAVRQEMSAVMGSARAKGWTTGTEVTMRGDRFCLPLRSGESNKVAGIIHDRSSTGATFLN